MQQLKRNLLPLSLMLLIPVLNIFYKILNNSHGEVNDLVTDIDRGIPFLKIFIIPYISWYFFIFIVLAYLCIKDKKTYFTTLAAFSISLIVCYVTYYFFQTTVPRPNLISTDPLTKMVAFIYTIDRPFNCFPSIHSLSSYLMIKGINNIKHDKPFIKLAVKTTSVSIILSTFFIKQHVILDAVAAILLGDIIFKIVNGFEKERLTAWVMKPYSLWMMKKKLETS